jgi:hypothetical protein
LFTTPGGSALRAAPLAGSSGLHHSGIIGNSMANAPRHTTTWNHATAGQLQHVHSNLHHIVNSVPATRNHVVATPQRATNLASQGNTIRNNWNRAGHHHHAFYNNWWLGRSFIGFGGLGWYGGWGYSPWLGYRPWWYWWNTPSWNSCVAWLPGYGWNNGNGYYYDYGPGGNVVYQNGQVLIDGQPVATDAEYADSAALLANVDPAELKAVAPEDWMALGTFSMAVSDGEVDPARVLQLAVSKNGLISGTIHNQQSGNTYTVQGRVDKETQRVAFTIGDDRNRVLETGLYNLTQEQTPVLCHFGTNQSQVYLLARLPEPTHEGAAAPAPPTSDAPTPAPAPAEAAPAPPAAVPAAPQETE